MIAGIHNSQQIFAIDMSQAYFAIVTTIWRPGLTKIKLHMKSSPAFPLCLSAYSYRLFKTFNSKTVGTTQKLVRLFNFKQ